MRSRLAPLSLAALALGLLVLDYVLAFGVEGVETADQRAIPAGLAGPGVAYLATARVLDTISVGSLVIAAGGLVAVALVRGRLLQAVGAAVVIAGANVTTQLAKPALAELDPLGGDAERFSQGIFPSGHATVAMSLALALVIVVPAAVRPVAAVVGAFYAAAVGIGLVLLGWHFPSDVAGGFLVATLWAGLVVTWLWRGTGPDPATSAPAAGVRAPAAGVRWGVTVALVIAAAVALAAALAIGVRISDVSDVAEYGRLRTAFVGGSAAIVLLALALPASVAALMLGRVKRDPSGAR